MTIILIWHLYEDENENTEFINNLVIYNNSFTFGLC